LAEFGDLKENLADAVALADTNGTPVQAAGSEIFTHCAVIQGETLFLQLIDSLCGDEKDGLAGSPVNLRVRVPVAPDSERSHDASRDGAFRKPAGRNVNLQNRSGCHPLSILAGVVIVPFLRNP